MKKEHVIFLVLIICSAMVCASTLVITNNLTLLAEHSEKAQLAAKAGNTVRNTQASIENPAAAKNVDRVQAATLVVAATDSKTAGEVMLITPAEQEQIQNMLATLSTTDSGEYTQLIKDFQNQHSLSPTGEMDTTTLNEIMRQVAIMKTNEALS